MARSWILASAVAAILGVTASGLVTPASALDSTSRQQRETFGWQPPNARMLNNKTEGQLDVNSAGTAGYASNAGYATNAGMLGGQTPGGLTVGYASSAGSTGYANSAGTANSSSTSNYANTAGNGVAGVSGSSLTLSNGSTVSLPGGGGGGGGFFCSGGSVSGWEYSGPTVAANGWGSFPTMTCQCVGSNTWSNCQSL